MSKIDQMRLEWKNKTKHYWIICWSDDVWSGPMTFISFEFEGDFQKKIIYFSRRYFKMYNVWTFHLTVVVIIIYLT